MKLPQPKVLPGQRVYIFNRKRGPRIEYALRGEWETGICNSCELSISGSHDYAKQYVSWSYEVILDRRTPSNISYGRERGDKMLRLSVGNEEIALSQDKPTS